MARTASYDRDAALDAAMALFWAKGYHATSLKDLEAALDMKPGSIYAAFQNKEALFGAALDRYGARSAAELHMAVHTAPSPLAALQDYLMRLADPAPKGTPSTACMMVKSLLEVPPDSALRGHVLKLLDQTEALLTDAFTRAVALGELPSDSDPVRLARRLQIYIFGLKIQLQRENNPAGIYDLCRDLADEIGKLKQSD